MTHSTFRSTVLTLAAAGAMLATTSQAGAGGFGAPGIGHGGGFRGGYGYNSRFGAARRLHGRIGRFGYPPAAVGYAGLPYYPPTGEAPSEPAVSTVNGNLSVYSKSVLIHRGPAFGEPGYVAQPVVYRLVPEPAQRPGTRRFRVEKLDF